MLPLIKNRDVNTSVESYEEDFFSKTLCKLTRSHNGIKIKV